MNSDSLMKFFSFADTHLITVLLKPYNLVTWDDFYCFVVLLGALKYEMLIQYIMMAVNIEIQDSYNKDTLVYFLEFIGCGNYNLLKDEMTFIEFINLLKEHQEFYSTLLQIQLKIWKKIKGYKWWRKIQTRRSDIVQQFSLFPCFHRSEIYPIDNEDRYYLLYQILFYYRNRFNPSSNYENEKRRNGAGSSYNSFNSNNADDERLKHNKISQGLLSNTNTNATNSTTTTNANNPTAPNSNNNSNTGLFMSKKIPLVQGSGCGFSVKNSVKMNGGGGSNCGGMPKTKVLIHEPPSIPSTPIHLSQSQQKNSNSSKISNSK